MTAVRVYLYIGSAIAAICAILYIGHMQASLRAQKALTVAAETQGEVNAAAATVASDVATRTTVIHRTTQEVTREVQALPSASTPLPDDVRSVLCGGLERMRDGSPACVDPRPVDPASAL